MVTHLSCMTTFVVTAPVIELPCILSSHSEMLQGSHKRRLLVVPGHMLAHASLNAELLDFLRVVKSLRSFSFSTCCFSHNV